MTDDRPLTTLEAVCRIRAHLWGIAGALTYQARLGRFTAACEARELDHLTDAAEVRHAVLVYPHEDA